MSTLTKDKPSVDSDAGSPFSEADISQTPESTDRTFKNLSWDPTKSAWLAFAGLLLTILVGNFLYRLALPLPPERIDAAVAPKIEFILNINQASIAQLQALPEIGIQLAKRIVVDRDTQGPYQTVDDLQRVRGFGPATLRELRSMLTVGEATPLQTKSSAEGSPPTSQE